jgi:hypothetical protein
LQRKLIICCELKKIYNAREEECSEWERDSLAGSGLDYGTDTDNEYDLTEEDQTSWIEDSLIGLPTPLQEESPGKGKASPIGTSASPQMQSKGIKSSPQGRKSYAQLKERREAPTAMIEQEFITEFLDVRAMRKAYITIHIDHFLKFLLRGRLRTCHKWRRTLPAEIKVKEMQQKHTANELTNLRKGRPRVLKKPARWIKMMFLMIQVTKVATAPGKVQAMRMSQQIEV